MIIVSPLALLLIAFVFYMLALFATFYVYDSNQQWFRIFREYLIRRFKEILHIEFKSNVERIIADLQREKVWELAFVTIRKYREIAKLQREKEEAATTNVTCVTTKRATSLH